MGKSVMDLAEETINDPLDEALRMFRSHPELYEIVDGAVAALALFGATEKAIAAAIISIVTAFKLGLETVKT